MSDIKRRRLELSDRYIPKSLHLDVQQHPLKIRPEGNLILADEDEKKRIADSVGSFKSLPDDVLLQIISFLDDKKDLVSLMQTSRFFYGLVSFDEIWRNLYMNQDDPQPFKKWRGSWKKSILQTDEEPEVDCSVVYSDVLFRPYQNTQVDYNEIFGKVVKEQRGLSKQVPGDARQMTPRSYYKGRIPRLEESTMTTEAFEKTWYNYPFILKDSHNKKRWPKWDMKYLLERFPSEKFRQESVEWPLAFYNAYAQSNKDEKPLYLFDCNSVAMKYLREEFDRPAYSKKDLLEVFGEGYRPDHTWLITGPARSGSTFHKDPNSTCAWNTVFEGSKLWVMFPPDMKPPGVHTDEEESEVTSPAGLAEWVLSGFYNDSVKISDEAANEDGLSCVVGVTFANECIFVPAGWWHLVINLEDTVALTANFVPDVRLGQVLNFFKHKPTQVSGFHPARFNELLKATMAAAGEGEISEENLKTFRRYLEQSPVEKNTNEDVGEMHDLQLDLPIYELLTELLKRKWPAELDRGEEDLKRIEEANREPKKSAMWENLTSGAEANGGFSFNFSD